MPLEDLPARSAPPWPRRLWIDTDAACGHSARTDPDDCFAIVLLARSPGVQIVGISAVAGNAPIGVVERTLLQLDIPAPVRSGPAARKALRAALEEGPLTVLALGPLTNVAAVLAERPSLAPRIARLVAVMGRRPGHIFHPAEGAGSGTLFGHGPVFRDFNFAMDVDAAARVLALGVPTSLVPYDAARGIELTAADLERLESAGGARAWTAERARGWLGYWRSEIGRAGFYPFDLIAAAYVLGPAWLRCTPVRATIGEDDTLFWPFDESTALMVAPDSSSSVLYCGSSQPALKAHLMQELLS
jgi:inosine-uridine nucleoside N-ribohydrolase